MPAPTENIGGRRYGFSLSYEYVALSCLIVHPTFAGAVHLMTKATRA